MQVSSFTDYSIRLLIYLAQLPSRELAHIDDVSHFYSVSKNHLVKITHKLGLLGYIETIRGKNGGIRLKMAANEIYIGELIRKIESLQLVNCGPEFCNITPICRLKNYMVDAKEVFLKELNQYTIHDLLINPAEFQSCSLNK